MSATRWVLLDDKDPSITYTGPWFERSDGFNMGNWGPPFGGSQHGINGTGSLSFSFTGTRVRVLGTSAVRNSSGVIDPAWTCIVGVTPITPSTPWTASINNWPLCESPTYQGGQYTFTLNTRSTQNTNLWFDQVRYLPLANMSSSMGGATVIVEHTDSSIQYPRGNWQPLTKSAIMTLQAGAMMTVKFTGTKLTWVGWTPSGYPTGNSEASYIIDSQSATTFQVPGLPSGLSALYNQHLFETPTLPLGEHTLTVTHNGPSAPLTLDHLLILNGDILLPGGKDVNSGEDGPDASSADPGSSQATKSASGPPVGAIAGGAAGGVVLILLCALGIIWFLRRRKRKRLTELNLRSPGPNTTFPPPVAQITPFSLTSPGNVGCNPARDSSSQTHLLSPQGGRTPLTTGKFRDAQTPTTPLAPHPQQVHRDQKIRPVTSISQSGSQMPSPYTYHPAGTMSDTSSSSGPASSYHSSNVLLNHHQDSGIRLASIDQLPPPAQQIIDVPPSYTPS